jgi:hypothetical protein
VGFTPLKRIRNLKIKLLTMNAYEKKRKKKGMPNGDGRRKHFPSAHRIETPVF